MREIKVRTHGPCMSITLSGSNILCNFTRDSRGKQLIERNFFFLLFWFRQLSLTRISLVLAIFPLGATSTMLHQSSSYQRKHRIENELVLVEKWGCYLSIWYRSHNYNWVQLIVFHFAKKKTCCFPYLQKKTVSIFRSQAYREPKGIMNYKSRVIKRKDRWDGTSMVQFSCSEWGSSKIPRPDLAFVPREFGCSWIQCMRTVTNCRIYSHIRASFSFASGQALTCGYIPL